MSEEIKICSICKNLGLDFKIGKFYCSLSYRPDKLPDVLSCDEFCLCSCVKHLEQENKELKEKVESYICNANCYKYKEAEKLLQTLNDIKSLAKQECIDECTFHYCKGESEKSTCVIYKIKTKIDEVLKNNVENN